MNIPKVKQFGFSLNQIFGKFDISTEEFQSSWSCSEQFNNLRL